MAWQFQTVHHDLWDYDNASPPALLTVRRAGSMIPAVAQATKTGMLFVLHRETGVPLFPVEERAVPASDVPGERAWPTQPMSSITLSPHGLPADQVWGANDADRTACRAMVSALRNEGIFTPPSLRGTLTRPSNIGGAHWGGVAVNPQRQIVVAPVNTIASMVQLIPDDGFDDDSAETSSDRLNDGYEYTRMEGTGYIMRRRLLRAPSGAFCSPPPWGALVAVDLATGRRKWEVPLGTLSASGPATGSPNLGGPLATAGDLVFQGMADGAFAAYDARGGKELWRFHAGLGIISAPMSFSAV